MFRLSKITAALLLALWLPATLHCRLEGLGFSALFACHDDTATTTHTTDCTDDGCQSLEAGQFTLSKSRVDLTVLPDLACAGLHGVLEIALPAPATEISATGQDTTLPLQRTWQFARRAALPARAPDTLNV